MRRARLAFAVLAFAALLLAPPAAAYVYWADAGIDQVGRANGGGQGINRNFIPGGANKPGEGVEGVAVAGSYIYWTNTFADTIGRARLNGTQVDQDFITAPGAPVGIAVDDQHIYWSTDNLGSIAIGRANVDGTGVDSKFITTGISDGSGMAIDDTHVYWANFTTDTIARAKLNGTAIEPSFITGASEPTAIDVNAGLIYWVNAERGVWTIGRASLDDVPNSVDQSFITGAIGPLGVAVNATRIYWTNAGNPTSIGRANLDGTGVDQSLIDLPSRALPWEIAVNAGAANCAGREATIVGTGRSEKLTGTNGDDVIAAQGGDDRVVGLRGDDLVCGGGGADVIRGQGGDDMLRGGSGKDELRGGRGSNRCRSGRDSDSKQDC